MTPTGCLGSVRGPVPFHGGAAERRTGLGEDTPATSRSSPPRWFVVRDARDAKLSLLNPRWAMSYLRGPMTGRELRRLRGNVDAGAQP